MIKFILSCRFSKSDFNFWLTPLADSHWLAPIKGLIFFDLRRWCHPRFLLFVWQQLCWLRVTPCVWVSLIRAGQVSDLQTWIPNLEGFVCSANKCSNCFLAAKLPPGRGWWRELTRPKSFLPSCRPFMGLDPPCSTQEHKLDTTEFISFSEPYNGRRYHRQSINRYRDMDFAWKNEIIEFNDSNCWSFLLDFVTIHIFFAKFETYAILIQYSNYW